MNVLVIAPHPDDESIGPGGTIRLHAGRGDRVVVVFLTSGELGLGSLPPEEAWRTREAEAARAGEILGIAAQHFLRLPDWYCGTHVSRGAQALRAVVAQELPARIFLPHPREWHPDHQASLPILQEALRLTEWPDGHVKPWLLGYEVWTPLEAHDHVEDISSVIRSKLRAVRCHMSQLGAFRYDHAVRGLSRYRGILHGQTRFAEVFCDLTSLPARRNSDSSEFPAP